MFRSSVHRDIECTDCHSDVDAADLPHAEKLKPVYCGTCHDDEQLDFDASIHGQAFNRHAPYAPSCKACHGVHDIFSPQDDRSRAYKMNVPYLCGQCHREGAPVANTYEIGEHNILENYTESIHGEGLFKKGLMVTAACADCHNAHLILPHTEPRASIIAAQHHRDVHALPREDRGRARQGDPRRALGEGARRDSGLHRLPRAAPRAQGSDRAHHLRPQLPEVPRAAGMHSYENGDTVCHGERGRSGHVGAQDDSVREVPRDVDPRRQRPCEPSGAVDCSNCHAKISEEYTVSGHGQAHAKGIEQAPYCTDCHGSHKALSHLDEAARTHRASVPELCGAAIAPRARPRWRDAHLSQDDALVRLFAERARESADGERAAPECRVHRLPFVAHGAQAR